MVHTIEWVELWLYRRHVSKVVGLMLVAMLLTISFPSATVGVSTQPQYDRRHRSLKKPKRPHVLVSDPTVDIRSPGEGEVLLRTKTVNIIAEVTGEFRGVFYDIDGMNIRNPMTRWGLTDRYSASWTISESEGSHELYVMAVEEDGWGAVKIVSVSGTTVNIVTNHEAEIWYEIDYLSGHAPTSDMLNYWVSYWDSRAIIAYPILDDVITDPKYEVLYLDLFWELEENYNDDLPQAPGDDRAYGNVNNSKPDLQEKWMLWGAYWWQANIGGFCYVWRSGYDGFAGNYIFMNDGGLAEWEASHGLTNNGGRIIALMHETGHSIGVIIYNPNSEEVYDPDYYSVMAIIRANYNAGFTNLWYYSHEYWDTKNLEYY